MACMGVVIQKPAGSVWTRGLLQPVSLYFIG